MDYEALLQHVEDNFPKAKGKLFFSQLEIAQILGVHRNTARELIVNNHVPGYSIGKRLMYSLRDVAEYLVASRDSA